MWRVFPLLCFILISTRLYAQAPAAGVLFSVNEGLSQGMVFDLLQSRDGYLWIATKDGLNRYYGYGFEVFSPDAFDPFAIGASEIRKLFEDSRGRLWISHLDGLDVFLPRSGRFFHLPKPQLPLLTGRHKGVSPLTFAETPDGAIWITDHERLWRMDLPDAAVEAAEKAGSAYPQYDITAIEMPLLPGDSGSRIQAKSVFFSLRHGLMIGASQGLYRLDPATRKPLPAALPGLSLRIAGEDSSGALWLKVLTPEYQRYALGSFSEIDDYYASFDLYTWDGRTADQVNLSIGYPNLLRFEDGGRLWVLEGNTLRRWRVESLRRSGPPSVEWAFIDPLTKAPIFNGLSLTIDRSGLVWLGTNGYGILKFNPEKPKFSSFLARRSQRAVFEDPDGKLFTFEGHDRLYLNARFDQSIPNPWYIIAPSEIGYFPTVFDPAGNGWGNNTTVGNLFRIDARTKALRQFPRNGYGLIYSQKGMLLSAQEEGLMQFDTATEQSTLFPFPRHWDIGALQSFYSHQLYESADGTVWIFAFEGLIKAVAAGEDYEFVQYKNDPENPGSLSGNTILCVADDPLEPHRYLWAGAKGGGLNRLDKQTGAVKHFRAQQGLPDNVLYGILPGNDGYLWLSTNKGLSRFHARDETVKNFTVADGLQDNEFNTGSYLKTRAGLLIFGGVNGLTVFHPDSLRFNRNAPQTRIVGFSVGNAPRRYLSDALINLSHRQNFLGFEFSALEFTNPAQNRYRYQLTKQGAFDRREAGDWIELGRQNTVQFANLPPGRYAFRVLGSNNDGTWGEQPAVVEFVIRPPWWASWWAYLLYLVAVAAVVLLIYRYQLRRKLEHQEVLRLRELDEFKNRFFTNITHEFRTPLTVILGLNQQLTIEEEQPEKKRRLGLVRRNGENLLRLINQLLDLAKIESKSLKIHYEQGDVLPYLRYIAESLHSLANAQNLMVRVESSKPEIVMDYDPDRLLQIVHNLLSNAIKFTPSGGRIVLRADLTNFQNLPNLRLTVADTGVGIPPDDLPHIFGRFYQAGNLKHAQTGPAGAGGTPHWGTGIGLALTKELVQAMGGDISVISPAPGTGGKGTEFTVLLPITRKAAMREQAAWSAPPGAPRLSAASALQAAPGSSDDLAALESKRLLIIEDNPDVVEYLAACLGEHYRLDFTYNGRSGIECAQETVPDLIVSDVMMPEKDGFEVCDTLKNDERTSHIPIVLLTAKADVESRIAGLRRGADAYLAKPFDMEELAALLESLLERQKRMAIYFSGKGQEPSPAEMTEDIRVEDAFVQKLRQIVEENYGDEDFGLPELCRKTGMSRSQLFRKMKALMDESPANFIRSYRLNKARTLLETTGITVSEAAWAVGYKNLSHFSNSFQEEFGFPPSEINK
jgi:signal transduction histidine kinase/DNA-binding response OmpR family regulator/ligand-binding sensor domain-containing protein